MEAVFVVGFVNDAAPHTTQKTLSVLLKRLSFNNLTLSPHNDEFSHLRSGMSNSFYTRGHILLKWAGPVKVLFLPVNQNVTTNVIPDIS